MTARQKCKQLKQELAVLILRLQGEKDRNDLFSGLLTFEENRFQKFKIEQERSDKECAMLWRKVEELEREERR